MPGKMSREKGKRGEREVANILRRHGYTNARRGQQFQGSPDSPDVIGIPGVHMEVKRVESFHLWDSLEQSVGDAGSDIPVVAHRRNNSPWIAVLHLDDFIKLCTLAQQGMLAQEQITEEQQNSVMLEV